MELVFTKGPGKYDRLLLRRPGQADAIIDCPKQRIIPHDMVHFAIEETLDARGFLGRVAAGEAADLTMAGEAESDGVERLVEVFQGDGWSGGNTPAAEMIDLYRVTCEARACPMLPIDAAVIDIIRARIADLEMQWAAVPVGGALTLRLDHK